MKKIVKIALFATVLVSLASCSKKESSQAASSGSGAGSASKTYKIQLITMDQMDQHWANVNKGAQRAAAELGNVEYKWNAPQQKDDAQQIECINNAVAQGADAILLAANGPDAVTSALREATAAGVKIIYVDSPANYNAEGTFSTDNKSAGKTAGEQMLKAFSDKGISGGKIGVISVNSATASTVAREEGFRSAFVGSAFEILETQFCDGDASRSKDAASNFITQGVVGLFGANEGSTVGIGNAIRESGSEIVGVGFDTSDTIKQQLKDGYILCTMAQNPDTMGYEGLKAAVTVLSGGSLANKSVDTGVSVIDKNAL